MLASRWRETRGRQYPGTTCWIDHIPMQLLARYPPAGLHALEVEPKQTQELHWCTVQVLYLVCVQSWSQNPHAEPTCLWERQQKAHWPSYQETNAVLAKLHQLSLMQSTIGIILVTSQVRLQLWVKTIIFHFPFSILRAALMRLEFLKQRTPRYGAGEAIRLSGLKWHNLVLGVCLMILGQSRTRRWRCWLTAWRGHLCIPVACRPMYALGGEWQKTDSAQGRPHQTPLKTYQLVIHCA